MLHNLNIKKQNFQNIYNNNNNKNHLNSDISYVNNFSEIFNGNHLVSCDNIISNHNRNNTNHNNGNIKEDICIPLPPPPVVTEKSKIEILNRISYEKNSFLLWIVTPLAASFSVAIIIAALAGPLWLLTEEKMPNGNYNGTANYNVKDDGLYVTKYTKSSLWVLCTTLGTEFRCSTIDYFPKDEYSPDPNDSTMAIPYAITKSTPFFLLSGIALIISYILLLVAMCSQQHRLYFFTSGILFIISGLLMLIGLIMYISIFKAEIGFKLRPRSSLQPPLFTFRYGQSFFLYVVGFIVTEFVGILNVFLYIRLQHIGYDKSTLCFGYYRTSNIVENRNSNKCSSTTSDRISVFGCKMHTIPCFHSLQEPRYFFEKPLPCNVHHHNLTNSLNELRSDHQPYSTLSYDFPVPPRAFTRSVSTTTDIYNNHTPDKKSYQDYNCNMSNSGTIGSIKNQLNKNCNNSNNTLNVNGANDEGAKEMKFLEFCKMVGQKEKPKDIYYIDNDCMSMNSNIYIIDPEDQCKNKYNYNANSNRSLANYDQPPNCVYYKRYDNGGSYNNVHQRIGHENHLNYLQPTADVDNKYYYQSRTLPRNFMKKNWDMASDSMMTRRTSVNGLFVPDANADNNSYYNKSHEHEKTDMLATAKWPSVLKSTANYSLRAQQSHSPHCGRHSDHDIFDLEKIENERRKSHANLFTEDYLDSYEYGKSTAV